MLGRCPGSKLHPDPEELLLRKNKIVGEQERTVGKTSPLGSFG